jgi:hypothetical protein
VFRVWRTEAERQAMVDHSIKMTMARLPYAWSEIAQIGAATILPHKWVPSWDLSRGVICSNHVAQCIKAARPQDYAQYFRYEPHGMWPGGVIFDMTAMLWDDQRSLEAGVGPRG